METTVATKGRIIIPAEIRYKFGIEDKTRIRIQVDEANRRIVLTPLTRGYANRLRGKYKGKPLMKALMTEKTRERQS